MRFVSHYGLITPVDLSYLVPFEIKYFVFGKITRKWHIKSQILLS